MLSLVACWVWLDKKSYRQNPLVYSLMEKSDLTFWAFYFKQIKCMLVVTIHYLNFLHPYITFNTLISDLLLRLKLFAIWMMGHMSNCNVKGVEHCHDPKEIYNQLYNWSYLACSISSLFWFYGLELNCFNKSSTAWNKQQNKLGLRFVTFRMTHVSQITYLC